MMAFWTDFSRHLVRGILAMWLLTASPAAWGRAADSLPEEAHWIWSPVHTKQHVPAGDCYFRKSFTMEAPEQGEIDITCDDSYELYVNGKLVGQDSSWKTLDHYEITAHLAAGTNVVAIKATNQAAGSAALAARIVVKDRSGTHVAYPTGTDWLTSLKASTHWNKPARGETGWVPAQSFGRLGTVAPWGSEVQVAGEYGRYRSKPDFSVEWVVSPEETGSLLAMVFNETGQILASREGSGIVLIRDEDQDGVHETVATYSDQVKNCQGLLAINGQVLAVGDGPEGAALYRLSDTDKDARADQVEKIVGFRIHNKMSEHGPHAVRLGPEGLIYVLVGNHGALADDRKFAESSPHRSYYDGDLVQPRYEDPGGHAAGIKAPGGIVVRTDAEGSFVELVAGGLRNPYDLAFHRDGELFTFDADMEWDIGTPWYRPTRVSHLPPGAEMGWRSGWAKWPSHYLDSLPATIDLGPGSPTGLEFYDHVTYPVRYQQVLFAGDWARGRIYAIRLERQGATYRAESEVFLEGKPLNVTDLAVGPDGWLYFCTGGRGTTGGIYRVVWNGEVPPHVAEMGEGIQRAIRQPQLTSAWARQVIAHVQEKLGSEWSPQLATVAETTSLPHAPRIRALDLMQLFGPAPSAELLIKLSQDKDPQVRAKAAYLMGLGTDDASGGRLLAMLGDGDPSVRRVACESLIRGGYEPPVDRLLPLLIDSDRFVAYAARRTLERIPPAEWQQQVLSARRIRVFLQGATALMVAHPSRELGLAVTTRAVGLLQGNVQEPGLPKGFIRDEDMLDLLRVLQLALIRGELSPRDVPQLSGQLEREYPSRSTTMNRELVRLLAHLAPPSTAPQMLGQLASRIGPEEKLHIAMHAPLMPQGWGSQQKLDLLRFCEQARGLPGGKSLGRYVDQAARRLAERMTDAEKLQALAGGRQWPAAALAVLMTLPAEPGKAVLRQIKQLDRELERDSSDEADQLRVGIAAVLGRSRDPQAMAYLRQLFQENPSRRTTLVMGLAQSPDGENWPLLVGSLGILDGLAAAEVLTRLAEVDRSPENPEPIRQAILCGMRNPAQAGPAAVKLLSHWAKQDVATGAAGTSESLARWQSWFTSTYPDHPEPRLPEESDENRWTMAELISFLESPAAAQGDPRRGADVFRRADCAKCHRYGDVGERSGPDLTTVSRRFHTREILEAILFPSHVISDQYASQTVLTTDGRALTGILVETTPQHIVLMLSDAQKVEIAADQVEETSPSKQSAMPEGLLNRLSLSEIADLFAYLASAPRSVVTSRRVRPSR